MTEYNNAKFKLKLKFKLAVVVHFQGFEKYIDTTFFVLSVAKISIS